MRLRHTLPLLALVAAPAFAQGVHFGLQAGISLPQGDVKDAVDSKMGLSIGLNLGVELNGGHVLRPRLDYTSTKGTPADLGIDHTVTTTAIGADYNYFVSGKAAEGFYLIGGLGFATTKSELSAFGMSVSESKSAMSLALGGGYQFNSLVGMELRYTTTKPDFDGESIKNDAINLGVTFRF
jgi:opacity protein-like surface antigen